MEKRFNSIILLLVMAQVHGLAQENSIKTSFSGLFTGQFNIGYERVINGKSSANFKIGYWKPTISPFISGNTFIPSAFTFQDSHGAIDFSAEYRFFIGKKGAPQGFYLGPYLRNFNIAAQYTDEIDGDVFDVDTRIHTWGVGAQMGYQWIIREFFTVDLSFFGAGADFYNMKLVYTIDKPGLNYNSVIDDIEEGFEDVKYLQKKLRHKVSTDNETTRLPFLFPGFRASINIGVAF